MIVTAERFILIPRDRHYTWQLDEWDHWSFLVNAHRVRACAMYVPTTSGPHDEGSLYRGFLAHEARVKVIGLPRCEMTLIRCVPMSDAEIVAHLDEFGMTARAYLCILSESGLFVTRPLAPAPADQSPPPPASGQVQGR